jgi:hypothetical protein
MQIRYLKATTDDRSYFLCFALHDVALPLSKAGVSTSRIYLELVEPAVVLSFRRGGETDRTPIRWHSEKPSNVMRR